MELYAETLDPSETKDYSWDWSPKLAEGETVTSQVVTFVASAGTSNPSNNLASPISRVWLSGGTHGQRAIFSIVATTSAGRTLDTALAVDVVDNALTPAEPSDVERITAELAAARALRSKIVSGDAITELWRDGRRVRKQVPSLEEITNHIVRLERDLSQANSVADGGTRRRAISLAYGN